MAVLSTSPPGILEGTRDPRVLELEKRPVPGAGILGRMLRHDMHGAIYEARTKGKDVRLWARITPMPVELPASISGLEHANISSIRGQARLETGQGAVIFDAPRGESLAERLGRQQQLEPDEAVSSVLQILYALRAIHDVGVLHANVSALNIYWIKIGSSEGQIRLIDHWLGSSGSRQNSPNYRAPEQIRHHSPISRATDIWGVGVILYEMLQGGRPFDGRTESEVVGKILLMDPRLKPPATELGKMLLGVVARCMRKKPEERYQSVTAVIDELLSLQQEFGGMNAAAASRLQLSVAPLQSVPSAAPAPLAAKSSAARSTTQKVPLSPKDPPQEEESDELERHSVPTPFAVPVYQPPVTPVGSSTVKPPPMPVPEVSRTKTESEESEVFDLATMEATGLVTTSTSDSFSVYDVETGSVIGHASPPATPQAVEDADLSTGPSFVKRRLSLEWLLMGVASLRHWFSPRFSMGAASFRHWFSSRLLIRAASFKHWLLSRFSMGAASFKVWLSSFKVWLSSRRLSIGALSSRRWLSSRRFWIAAGVGGLALLAIIVVLLSSSGKSEQDSEAESAQTTSAGSQPQESQEPLESQSAAGKTEPEPEPEAKVAPEPETAPSPVVAEPPREKRSATRVNSDAPTKKAAPIPRKTGGVKKAAPIRGKKLGKKKAKGPKAVGTNEEADADALASNPFGG